MKTVDTQSQKPSKLFSRIMVIVFALLLAVMIIFKYFLIVPTEELSFGLIILIAILLVVALSESFDNFSIGNLITLKRRNNELKTEKDNLQTRYDTLLQSYFSQSQVTHNINADSVIIRDATSEEAKDKEAQEEDNNSDNKKEHYRAKRISPSAIQDFCLKKYLEKNNLKRESLRSDIKLEFVGDPISEKSYVYDYYYESPMEDVFVETRRIGISTLLNDRLYNALCKIWWYNQRNNKKARLDLLLFSPSNDISDATYVSRNERNQEALYQYFSVARQSKLLNIIKIEATAEDMKALQSMQ